MILVTGGAGYIGSHAIVELLQEGYQIVAVDSLSNSHIESILRVKELAGKDFIFHQMDLLDYEALDEIFRIYKIDAVMHFAGFKAVGESVEQPLAYYRNNIVGTLNLCEIMKKYNVKKLVFSSSATVYGHSDQVPIDETSPLKATNPYGRTKLFIEEFLQDLYNSDSTWRIAVLRYFNPIGAHESGKIGEDPAGIPNNLMPFITQVAIGKREKLQVFGNDYPTHDGTGVRDYIHVTDLVKGHVKALLYLKAHEGIETFNLGTGKGFSVMDLVKSFTEATAIDISYQFVPRRPGDVSECYANPEKAKNLLGWQTHKNLQDMCRDSWNWQSRNPNGYLNPLHSMTVPSKQVSSV